MELNGRVGVVTGASRGLGAEIVKLITQQGGKVAAVSRSGRGSHAPTDSVIDVVGDVTVEQTFVDAIGRCMETYGAFDFIVNNAGILGESRVHETTNELWDALVATHMTGAFWGCKHAINAFRERGTGGAIVNIGSILSFTADGYLGAYTAMKSGVLGLTKVASADVARLGVRVNAVCPGPVETRMMRSIEAQRNPGNPQSVHDMTAANTPTGRYATPEEVANVVMYLCSEFAGDITGTHIVIDGGRSGTGGAPPAVPRPA